MSTCHSPCSCPPTDHAASAARPMASSGAVQTAGSPCRRAPTSATATVTTATATMTFVDEGATAQATVPTLLATAAPAQRADVSGAPPTNQPADVPAGDEAEHGDHRDVVQEVSQVASPTVVEQAADTLGGCQRTESANTGRNRCRTARVRTKAPEAT